MTIPRDSLYRSLAQQRRRHLIRYLRETGDGTARLGDLVEYIVQEESDASAPDSESVRIDLYHVHLPLLADTGVIEFDHRSETIRYRSHARLEAELDSISHGERKSDIDTEDVDISGR